jgi:signal transduction histidine kinase
MKTNRKTWIIDKKFQYHFIAHSILPTLLISLIFIIAIETIFFLILGRSIHLEVQIDKNYYNLLMTMKSYFFLAIIISSILMITTLTLWSIVMSNRVAGPIFRLKKYCREIKSEDFNDKPLQFRENDYFKDVAIEINQLIEKIRKETDKR